MIEVVAYTKKHRKEVADLVYQFHQNTLKEYGLEMEYDSVEHLEDIYKDGTFVLLDDGKVIGVIAGQIVEQIMSYKKVYQESIWYVDENYRKYGIKLLRHLEQWCADTGITQVVMARMVNSMGEKVDRFYRKMGYEPLEVHYIKDVV
jgi:GNAT superfamily N-acetyltransferase